MTTTNSNINTRLYPITKGPNPLHSFDDKHILATGNPDGKSLKNIFKKENIPLYTSKEKKIFKELDLNQIDPEKFYLGGIKRNKSTRRRHPPMYKKKRTHRRKSRKSRTNLKRRRLTNRR